MRGGRKGIEGGRKWEGGRRGRREGGKWEGGRRGRETVGGRSEGVGEKSPLNRTVAYSPVV